MSKTVLWVTVGAMALEPIINSLDYAYGKKLNIKHLVFDDIHDGSHNEVIIKNLILHTPQLILYIGPAEGPHLPALYAFKTMRNFGKVINIAMDAGCPGFWPVLKKYREEKVFDLIVSVDGNQDWPKGPNDMTTLCPIDPRYYENEVVKDVEVGFAGGDGSQDRKDFISALTREGLLTKAPRDEGYGTYQAYADFMLRCSIVVNFACTGSGKAMHVKNRVQEAGLSGACLLEQKGSPTKNYFMPGQDYFEYDSEASLISQIREIKNDPYRGVLAGESLQRKQKNYDPKIFWAKVFEKIGFEV